MTTRLLDASFRHWLLMLLPPVLIPLIVGPVALVVTPAYYETWAGIWVERPTYLTYTDDWNRYTTPAQNQAGRLNELLRTRSFVLDVAKKTQLAPLAATPEGEDLIAETLNKGMMIAPNGSQLVLMRFRAETPQVSYEVVNALIESFRDRAIADGSNQAALAISFYEARQQAAEEELMQARDALRRHVAANPRYSMIDPSVSAGATTGSRLSLPAAAIDPQLAELLRQLQVAEGNVDRARTSLDQAQYNAAAAMEGQAIGFQVVDAPRSPTTAIRERRRMLVYPIAGLLVGLGVSGSVLVVLVVSDGTARREDDLLPTARVLASVPSIRLQRMPKGAGPDVTRRAVGFAAGMALPAPGDTR